MDRPDSVSPGPVANNIVPAALFFGAFAGSILHGVPFECATLLLFAVSTLYGISAAYGKPKGPQNDGGDQFMSRSMPGKIFLWAIIAVLVCWTFITVLTTEDGHSIEDLQWRLRLIACCVLGICFLLFVLRIWKQSDLILISYGVVTPFIIRAIFTYSDGEFVFIVALLCLLIGAISYLVATYMQGIIAEITFLTVPSALLAGASVALATWSSVSSAFFDVIPAYCVVLAFVAYNPHEGSSNKTPNSGLIPYPEDKKTTGHDGTPQKGKPVPSALSNRPKEPEVKNISASPAVNIKAREPITTEQKEEERRQQPRTDNAGGMTDNSESTTNQIGTDLNKSVSPIDENDAEPQQGANIDQEGDDTPIEEETTKTGTGASKITTTESTTQGHPHTDSPKEQATRVTEAKETSDQLRDGAGTEQQIIQGGEDKHREDKSEKGEAENQQDQTLENGNPASELEMENNGHT